MRLFLLILVAFLGTSPFTYSQCNQPTGLSGTSATDSLFLSWNFTPSSTSFQAISFNVQYGMNGFTLGQGTIVSVNADVTDTIANTAILAGGVYDVYIQTVCAGSSSSYAGPITITMPLDNDLICNAELLSVNNTLYIFDNTGATTTLSECNTLTPPGSGYNSTNLPADGWGQDSLNATTWFKFIAPASGSVHFEGTDENATFSQIGIYSSVNCANLNAFQLISASDQIAPDTLEKVAPDFTICGLTPGQEYYVLHDSWYDTINGPIVGRYSIRLNPITLNAGSYSQLLKVCIGDTVNLFDGIDNYPQNGTWSSFYPIVNTGIQDSLFISNGLGYNVIYNIEYRKTYGCAFDTVNAKVRIYPPSSAGENGFFSVCKNEQVNLFQGLSGLVDMNGTWYDPTNTPLANGYITASSVGGSFNYDYVATNNVCPPDTANILVVVDPNCTASMDELLAKTLLKVYPNPFVDQLHIEGVSENANIYILDMMGRILFSQPVNQNDFIMDMSDVPSGMYMLQIIGQNLDLSYLVSK